MKIAENIKNIKFPLSALDFPRFFSHFRGADRKYNFF